MKRTIPIVLIVLTWLTACTNTSTPPNVPTPVPTFTPEPGTALLDEISAAVGPALMPGMHSLPYQEFPTFDASGRPTGDVSGVLSFPAVSTGKVETRTIAGHEVRTLRVYLLMQTGLVQEIPVATAVDDVSFTVLPAQTVITTTDITADGVPISVTLTYADPFKRGVLMDMVSDSSVTVFPNAIAWDACSEVFCKLGKKMDEEYPNTLWLLTLRALDTVPDGWVLFGFDVFPQWGQTTDELVVNLPEVHP